MVQQYSQTCQSKLIAVELDRWFHKDYYMAKGGAQSQAYSFICIVTVTHLDHVSCVRPSHF